jgi:hypothetical protein
MQHSSKKTLIMRLGLLRQQLWRLLHLVQEEWQSPVRVPWRTTFWLWKHGFLRKSYLLFALDQKTIHAYVSDYTCIVKTAFINGEAAVATENKLIFTQILQHYAPYLCTNYGIIRNGNIFPIEETIPLRSREDVVPFCKTHSPLVIKPTCGALGQNIMVVRLQGETCYLNESSLSYAEFTDFLAELDEYLICEYVQQHPYATTIFPHTANTIRLLTMWDFDQHQPFIPLAMHRFGRTATIPVDNWSKGGVSCAIDRSTGRLGKGVIFENGKSLYRVEKHPDTNAQLEGIMIPRWSEMTKKLLEIAAHIPFLPYIGWDVVITPEGFKILEGNSAPGLNIQMHGPLLNDPRVKKFYTHFHVL